jgi:uncharacterized SAM-binding protein YcdF (DUF218 family)
MQNQKVKQVFNILRKRNFRYALLLLFLFAMFLFLRNMGTLLLTNETAKPSDLMFVLLGPVPDRALWAAELYHNGTAKQILMANEYQAGLDAAMAKRLQIDKTAEVFFKALQSLGVPATQVHMLPDVAGSTRDEAIILRNYLEQHPEIRSVIIVTSSYHAARAQKLISKSLNKLDHQVTVCVPNNPHTVFDAKKWWRDRFSATMVALEYLKLGNYYLSDQFTL